MPRPSLRAVGENEVPAAPKSVTEAASNGTTRELLVAMRTRIAKAVEDPNAQSRDLAALTKRLMEVVRDIEAIDARRAADGDDAGPTVEDGEFNASAV